MSAPRTGDLRDTQRLFWDLITAPGGVAAAIDDLKARGLLGSGEIETLFAGDARLAATDRLDIYAGMYFYRLLDCLGEDFSKTQMAIGHGHFHRLAADYLARHPSTHPSLRHLGRHLPGFIAGHPLAEQFPWLADLARLEWARADVFDAPDAEPLSRETLAGLPQDRAGEARLTLVPAFSLQRFGFEVVRLWRLLDDAAGEEEHHAHATGNAARERTDEEMGGQAPQDGDARLDPPARRPAAARVWRHDGVIHHCSIDEDEARSLETIAEGGDIARICQALAAGRSVARGTERAGRMIQGWLDDGILAGVTLP